LITTIDCSGEIIIIIMFVYLIDDIRRNIQ